MSKYQCEECNKIFVLKSKYISHVHKDNIYLFKQNMNDIVKTMDNMKISKSINRNIICKPILKWVGGKTQIIETILSKFPYEMNNYHEIFLGGGSILLGFLSLVREGIIKVSGGIFAYDLNEPLINVYKNIKHNHELLYIEIQIIIKDFNECLHNDVNRNPITLDDAKESKENYYYWIRKKYNELSREEKNSIIGSALFIFLNKTCFRGVFRIGPNGFNVPYGHYKNPEIINKEHLNEVHNLLQNVTFICSDFSESLLNIGVKDFAYLDPPYAPETEKSFVGYTEFGFSLNKHYELFNIIHTMSCNDKKVLMSNSDVQLVKDNFQDNKYSIMSIQCKRSINSKKPDSKTNEVLISNY